MTPRRVAILGAAVASEVVGAGVLFAAVANVPVTTGFYWAVETASTVGYGDVSPHGSASRVVAIILMLTAVPLLGALFAGVTSLHITRKVEASEKRLDQKLDAHHAAIKQHITNIAVAATTVATEESNG